MDVEYLLGNVEIVLNNGNYEMAEAMLLGHIKKATELNDNGALLAFTNEYLNLLNKTSRYYEANIVIKNLLQLLDQMGLKGSIPYANSMVSIAKIYKFQLKTAEAIECFNEALPIMEEASNYFKTAYIYTSLATLYIGNADYDNAKANALKAVDAYEKANVNDSNLASALYLLGVVYSSENNIEGAKEAFTKALVLLKDEKDEFYYRINDELAKLKNRK